MKTVSVTGAGGWVGECICNELERRNIPVRRISTSNKSELKWDCLDNGSKEKLVHILAGSDTAIHCAGHVHRPVETPDEKKLFHQINVDGTRQFVNASQRAGVKRIVYISTIAIYKWKGMEPVGETGPVKTTTVYAETKYKGEQIVSDSGLDWLVIRLATVFGTGDQANFLKMAAAMKNRRFVIPASGQAKKSVISINDAASAISDAAFLADPKHRLFNLANPKVPTLSDMCEAFSDLCGFPPSPRIPLILLKTGAVLGDVAATAKPSFPLTSVNIRKLTTSTVVETTRMQENFPNRKWRPFREDLADSAEYYRSA